MCCNVNKIIIKNINNFHVEIHTCMYVRDTVINFNLNTVSVTVGCERSEARGVNTETLWHKAWPDRKLGVTKDAFLHRVQMLNK